MTFIKKVEDFTCEVCQTKVQGTGFTNHCPNCLWSKHVDLNTPGDRLSECQGLMEPVGVELKNGEYYLFHYCQKCGKTGKNKSNPKDNFEKIIELSKPTPRSLFPTKKP